MPRRILLLALASTPALATDLTTGHRAFADRFTVNPGGLWETASRTPNVCSSSLGVSMAFDIVYPGSTGECRSQLRDTFGYPAAAGSQVLVWAGAAARLQERYTGARKKDGSKHPIVRIANSVWIDNSMTLQSAYAQVVGDFVHQIDFADGARHVNEWCADMTEGLIPEVLSPGRIDVALLAVNAIYLNASWRNDFHEMRTNEDVFYTSPARKTAAPKPCHFMHQVARFPHSASAVPGFQVIQLPYASSSLSMIIALPMDSGAVTTSAAIVAALPKLHTERVALALPKFKFRSSFGETIIDTLKALGMTVPFDSGFPGIIEGRELFVGKVLQKTFLYVWEKGTEAAAVTVLMMRVTSVGPPPEAPVLFQADHPFQFWIYDQGEDIVLFEGKVSEPEVIDGAVAQSSAKHEEETFWTSQFGEDSDPVAASCGQGVVQLSVLLQCLVVVVLL